MSDDLAPLEEKTEKEKRDSLSLLAQQRYDVRKSAFWFAAIVSGSMFLLCLVFLIALVCSDYFLFLFIHSKHIAFLGLALMVIPSFILGQIVKATFSDDKQDYDPPKPPLQHFMDN